MGIRRPVPVSGMGIRRLLPLNRNEPAWDMSLLPGHWRSSSVRVFEYSRYRTRDGGETGKHQKRFSTKLETEDRFLSKLCASLAMYTVFIGLSSFFSYTVCDTTPSPKVVTAVKTLYHFANKVLHTRMKPTATSLSTATLPIRVWPQPG